MTHRFLDRIRDTVVLADGAMGTVLYGRGVYVNRCFDELNVSQPDLVLEVHRDYLKAGADLIETNTFGANRVTLAPHGLESQMREINRSGVALARRAVEESQRDAFVAGSIGPIRHPRQPHHLGGTELEEIYAEQIGALAEAGVDLFVIETISRRDEMAAALRAARAYPDIPIVAQMTFGEDGRTVEGDLPGPLALWMRDQGAHVVGCNCSTGPRAMLEVIEEMRAADPELLLSALPNAGSPEYVEGRYIYFCSPEYMATYARRFLKGWNVRLLGGCCGTTPDHIRSMRDSIRALNPARIEVVAPPSREETETPPAQIVPLPERSRFAARLAEGRFVTSVEMPPPKGADPTRVLERIRTLHAAGVDAVNIPDGPRATARMSPMALGSLVQQSIAIEPILHYCCRDRNLLGMQSDLLGAHALGIRNLIVITGDPPKLGDYPNATAVFDVDSIGLTRIVNRLNHGQDLAGNPLGAATSFLIGVGVNPAALNLDEEERRLRLKIAAGAEVVYTQPVFDTGRLFQLLERTEDLDVPVLVGILPLNSHRNAEFFQNEVPGMEVPEVVRKRLRQAGSDEAQRRVGVEIAREALHEARQSPRIRGAYVMPPFGRADRALEVLADVLATAETLPRDRE